MLENLAALAGKFLILSWPSAKRGTDGLYPLHTREKGSIIQKMHSLGMEYDTGITNELRKHTERESLKDELYTFRRISVPTGL